MCKNIILWVQVEQHYNINKILLSENTKMETRDTFRLYSLNEIVI